MPTGRFEKRIARAVTVEIRPEDEGMPKERTLTENVSPHGARVLIEREWQPGQQVMVISPKEGVRALGQIGYYELLAECSGLQKEVSDRLALARIPDRCERKIPIGPAVSVNRLRRIRSGHQ